MGIPLIGMLCTGWCGCIFAKLDLDISRWGGRWRVSTGLRSRGCFPFCLAWFLLGIMRVSLQVWPRLRLRCDLGASLFRLGRHWVQTGLLESELGIVALWVLSLLAYLWTFKVGVISECCLDMSTCELGIGIGKAFWLVRLVSQLEVEGREGSKIVSLRHTTSSGYPSGELMVF